jgi:hypothetical protein
VDGQRPIMAYVDVNAAGTLMKFAENAAVNRGITVRVFATVADAEKWLLELDTARIEKSLGVPGTARNWRTVCKLAELARN